MKRFIKYAALFFLPIACVAISLEILSRQIPNTYRYKYEWMQDHAKDVEILILGSSQTYYGVNPQYLHKNTFNLANVAQDIEHDLFLLEYWDDQYTKLKTVILPISTFSWFYRMKESSSSRCKYYKIYMDCNLYSDFSLHNLALDKETIKHIPALWEKKHRIDCDEYGWTAVKLSNKNSVEHIHALNGKGATKVAEMHTVDISKYENIEYNQIFIKRIADFCKSRDIQLVLITPPCWNAYCNQLNQDLLNKMYALTQAFQKEYDLQYLDYLKDERFVADDFSDCSHLSDVGAKKFTKILKKDLDL